MSNDTNTIFLEQTYEDALEAGYSKNEAQEIAVKCLDEGVTFNEYMHLMSDAVFGIQDKPSTDTVPPMHKTREN